MNLTLTEQFKYCPFPSLSLFVLQTMTIINPSQCTVCSRPAVAVCCCTGARVRPSCWCCRRRTSPSQASRQRGWSVLLWPCFPRRCGMLAISNTHTITHIKKLKTTEIMLSSFQKMFGYICNTQTIKISLIPTSNTSYTSNSFKKNKLIQILH
uniref:(northern house mosquito) hypothetical protein n=1 Tax=Culex pipiens TaxID=7175 RepID=A0A8D8BQW2_CULPI